MPSKYLVIFEDGSDWTEDAITVDLTAAWNAGIVSVFRFSPEVGFEYLSFTDEGEEVWTLVSPAPSEGA